MFSPSRSKSTNGSDSTLGEITRAAGWGATGFESYLIPQQDADALIDSPIRTADLPGSGDGEEVSLNSTIGELLTCLIKAIIVVRDSPADYRLGYRNNSWFQEMAIGRVPVNNIW